MMKKSLIVALAFLALFSPAVPASTTERKRMCDCGDNVNRFMNSLDDGFENLRSELMNADTDLASRSTDTLNETPELRLLPLIRLLPDAIATLITVLKK